MATAATVFRDYETDGVPASGRHKPKKPDIRQLLAGYESIINAFLSNGGLIFASKASLDASLTYAANTMAWVLGDATVANNGIYRKIGGSGTGSWTRVADLPFSFIIASDAGAGTANAIVATTSLPVSSSALVWTNIFEANTSSPVTISFNGGSALTVKTNAGNNVAVGGLVAGTIVMGIVSGSTFRLVSDQASSAVLASAEAAAAAAAASAAEVAAFAPNALRVDVVQAFDSTKRAQGRSNLGLGGAAVLSVGTTVGTVAAGDDSRIINAVQASRSVAAGSGLTGGGDLSVNRTIALSSASIASLAKADSAVQPNTSPTLSGANLSVTGSAQTLLSISGDAGSARRINLQTGSSHRWFIEASGGAETGSNAGSDFVITRRSDAGANLGSPLTITRSTGYLAFGTGLSFEDFGGFPTIQPTSRIIMRKAAPTNTDVYTVGILRDTVAGGTAGFVNSALRVETTVDTVTTSYEWPLLAKLTVNAAGGGEHCAAYAQAVKNANGTAWSLCTELRETITNPTTGSLGIEVGMFVTGTDSSEMRHAIDISIGSADNGTGTNIVSSAIRIGPATGNPARGQLTNGIQLKGRITSAIDMTQLDVSYSDVTVKMPTNGKLSWRDTNQTVRGELAWNATLNSWQVSGILNATSATAGGATALPATPTGYMHIQINGTMRKVPYYSA